MSYTKLFGSILDSTVWQEDLHVKVVWITMLAMKDIDGVVYAAIPGLAKRAGVTIAQCEEALSKFMAPDPYSSSKDFEGRRIAEVDRGWHVLNHDRYRDQLDNEDQRDKSARRQQKRRARFAEQGLNSRGEPTASRETGDASRESRGIRHADQIQIRSEDREGVPPSPPPGAPSLSLTSRSEKQKKPERKRPAHAIPPDWKPDATALKFAVDHRLDAAAQAVRFRDWHAAKGSTFVDWQAAFRTWLRNAVEFGSRQGPARSPPSAQAPIRSAVSEPMRFDLAGFDAAKGPDDVR